MLYDPVALAQDLAVTALPPHVRRAYLVLFVRLPPAGAYAEPDLVRVLAYALRGAATPAAAAPGDVRQALVDAGLLSGDAEIGWAPVAPATRRLAATLPDPAPQWEADAREAMRRAEVAGVLGDLDATGWRDVVDAVARERAGGAW